MKDPALPAGYLQAPPECIGRLELQLLFELLMGDHQRAGQLFHHIALP